MASHHDQLLHTLTAAQLAAASRQGSLGSLGNGRVLELEIAAWLHLPGLSELPVSLLVSYLDGNQSHEVLIDHGRLDMRQRILLSGVARLPVRQQLAAVELRLRSAVAPRSVRIEDIFVQPVTSVLI